MLERRSSKRLTLNLDAMFRHIETEQSYVAGVLDISFNGICAVVPEAFSPGELLECKVGLETGELVFLIAQVRWLSNYADGKSFKMGLHVIKGHNDDLTKFERYYNLRVLYPPLQR